MMQSERFIRDLVKYEQFMTVMQTLGFSRVEIASILESFYVDNISRPSQLDMDNLYYQIKLAAAKCYSEISVRNS